MQHQTNQGTFTRQSTAISQWRIYIYISLLDSARQFHWHFLIFSEVIGAPKNESYMLVSTRRSDRQKGNFNFDFMGTLICCFETIDSRKYIEKCFNHKQIFFFYSGHLKVL